MRVWFILAICLQAFFLSQFEAANQGLQITSLLVPLAVRSGEPVTLRCEYELGNETLYSVKWYKNNIEFYRYLPSDNPPGQSYELTGTVVDGSRSDKNKVHLKHTDLNTEGTYGCEVSTEGPGFKTVKKEGNLSIYVLPEEEPIIEGLLKRYQVMEFVNTTCYSRPSKPVAKLDWYINDKLVPSSFLTRTGPMRTETGLQEVAATLHFEVWPEHIQGNVIYFQCKASVSHGVFAINREMTIGENSPNDHHHRGEAPTIRIRNSHSHFRRDEKIEGNCSSPVLKDGVELKLFVNDQEVKKNYLSRHEEITTHNGKAAVLGLNYPLKPLHFQNSAIRVRCMAIHLQTTTWTRAEKAVGANQQSSGLVSENNGSVQSRAVSMALHWWILEAIFMLATVL